MTSNSNHENQKRCNCKKSKCLKLYCDCFAAGLYCDESCSCQECFNNPDYEDTVDDTRQQIEVREPLAFSPKIYCLIQAPTTRTEDGDQPSPIARKHRRGCNCKKSMCEKKYCECYRANVGCSSECRCEGCKNVFGKKGDYNAHNELATRTQFQHSGRIENISTNSMFTGCYIPSQGSANNHTMLETSNEISNLVHLDQQSSPNVDRIPELIHTSIDELGKQFKR